jgi:tetratricopeptide (TPR) repeat protein
LKIKLLSLFFIFATNAYPCWHSGYTPDEYWVFYAYDINSKPKTSTATEQNIVEWQRYTAGKANFDDVWDVVYRYSLVDMEQINNKQNAMKKNSFAKYLMDNNDIEAINYLILAKKCEMQRSKRRDPWWYPTKDDLKNNDLREILDEALAYKGSKFKARYRLQALRAAYTMGEYDLCLKLWHNHIKRQPASAVRTMCEDYIGGIYFKRGDYETAIRHYANTMQQSESFWWCVDNMTKAKSDIDRIGILYRYCPTSPELAVMVQKICREAEQLANRKIFIKETDSSYLKNRDRYITLRNFALQAATEGRSDNPAMWQYAAAFLTMLDGDTQSAFQYIAKAAQMRGTTFVKDNIKVLHLMLDAMTGEYDEEFEARILPQMKWLDGKIWKKLSELEKQDFKKYPDHYYSTFQNYSFDYFNDMMRKITLSVMAPRYRNKGQPVKAFMLTGMASERLRTLSGFRNVGYCETCWRNKCDDMNIDFYTDIFQAMDAAPVEDVIAYRDALRQGGDGEFERFLAARCYQHGSYFNELIGTKYMREEQFDLAVEYLSKVPAAYDTTLNIYPFFRFDPFREDFHIGRSHRFIKPAPGYKRKYARQMLALQNGMNTAPNEHAKNLATFQYAVGLMHATIDCWALLHYKQGILWHTGDYFQINERNPKMEAHCSELFEQVLASSNNIELKARCLAAQAWISGDDSWKYEKNANGRWVKTKNPNGIFFQLSSPAYANTTISKLLFSKCDVFQSYRKE